MTSFFVFLYGAIVGSFLNVCIYRMPREESIVKPRSKCVHCEKPIAWHDNIPLLSYIVLKGKCRSCGKGFSPRYFFVELVTAISWVFLWQRFGFTGHWTAGIILFSLLIALTVTDLETGFLPDLLTFPGMFAGLVLSTLIPSLQGRVFWYEGFKDSLVGLLAGGLILLTIGLLGNAIYKKDTMGGGDIKLLAMLGAFLGVKKITLVFFLSPFFALPIALYVKFIQKEETIPYGPYIAIAGAICFLYGQRWVEQYYFFQLF